MSLQAIIEHINSNRYESAHEIVESELKKNPKNYSLLTVKSYICMKTHRKAAALQCAEVVIREGNYNYTVIEMFLAPVLYLYDQRDTLLSALENLIRRNPSDSEAVELLYSFGFALQSKKAIYKALVAKNRLVHSQESMLQTCLAVNMVYNELGQDDVQRKVLPALGSRILEKCGPPKTLQEAYIWAITLGMSSVEKMVEFLMRPAILKHDSLQLQIMLIEGLEKLERWEDLLRTSVQFLEKLDSFTYWKSMNLALVKLNRIPEAREFAYRYEKTSNNLLAAVHLESLLPNGDVLGCLISYWKRFSTRRGTYEFLKTYVDTPGFAQFLKSTDVDNVESQVNQVKLLYRGGHSYSAEELMALYRESLNSKPSDKRDYFSGSDLLMIAAIEILKSNDTFKLEKATALLEYAWQNDPDQFHLRLWLLKLYRFMGIMNEAQRHFFDLSIRSAQLDTLSHLLLTRGSTLNVDRKLYKDLSSMYQESERISDYASTALATGSYTEVESIVDLARRMRLSLNQAIYKLEIVKAARIHGGSENYDTVANLPKSFVDNRDYSTLFDPRSEMATALELAPRPSEKWVRAQEYKEALYHIKLTGSVADLGTANLDELTKVEKWSLKQVENLGTSWESYHLKTKFNWMFLHEAYTVLETCKLADAFQAKKKCIVAGTSVARSAVRARAQEAIQSTASYAAELSSELAAWNSDLGVPQVQAVVDRIVAGREAGLRALVNAAR